MRCGDKGDFVLFTYLARVQDVHMRTQIENHAFYVFREYSDAVFVP